MYLESIRLENFRQFINESIDFAQGKDGRNVTIIIGENGTGKTTLAQAFLWCMYGKTSFSDPIVLNKKVRGDMAINQEKEVKVTLKLRHADVEYTLVREQKYLKCDGNTQLDKDLKPDFTVFNIYRKGPDGITQQIKKTQLESEVNSILPENLSRYFFFDGERITNMSKDISDGKKSTDFAEAVKGLLGLNAMQSAMNHFNPNSQYSVIGRYVKKLNASSNGKVIGYKTQIEKYDAEINERKGRIEKLKNEKKDANARKKEKETKLMELEDGAKLQEEKEKLQDDINRALKSRSDDVKAICKDFNKGMNSFFSGWLIVQALNFLKDKNIAEKDIPSMRADTIQQLLDRGFCICGTPLNEGSEPYKVVCELKDYLPPNSIGSAIGDFKKEARLRAKSNIDLDLGKEIKEKLVKISEQDDVINNCSTDIEDIDKKLRSGDVSARVREIQTEIENCEKTVTKNDTEINKLNRELGEYETKKKLAESERDEYALQDKENKSTVIFKAYAERIYEELKKVYDSSEAEIRNQVETTINEIFKQIYEGGLSLTIDEGYHISVSATDYEGYVETSTAQSIAVIFAFITAIIKIAKENRNATDENEQLLSSESYPLVMDAPLSSFDKRRIKTVCATLPTIAEQVVIFIKDTDGNIAEEYLGHRIGNSHTFKKITEFETIVDQ